MTREAPLRDERDRALASGGDLTASALVEAGAGTGKTSVLIERILALVRAGTGLSRIVAITFTEKAAGELRMRLRAEIERAACPRGEGGPGHRAATTSDAERALFEAALHEIDRAQIGTIHGFCTALLKERPVEAGVDPGFGVAEELRRTLIQDAAWDAWLREELRRGLPAPVAQASALGFGLTRIRALGDRLVSQRDLLDLAPGPTDPGDVAGLVARMRAAARAFEAAAATECDDPDDLALPEIAAFVGAVRAVDLLPVGAQAAFALDRVKPAPVGKGRKGNWRGDTLADVRAEAKALREIQADLRRRASHNAAVGLLEWLRGYVRAYEDEKRRLGLVDFEDLLLSARNLLRDRSDVREYFKDAYDRILVDEFQDTDPLQCEVVFFLSEAKGACAGDWTSVKLEPGKLFLVGDPKQSIYRFRRADIEMYELAKELVAKRGAVWHLTENFRSRPRVVDGVNLVFREKMMPPADGRRYQPAYVELLAHRARDERGPGIVVLPSASDETSAGGRRDEDGKSERRRDTDEEAEGPAAALAREEEARSVTAFIAKALEDRAIDIYDKDARSLRPLALRDIAILFHATTGLDAYSGALDERGLEYRIAGGRRFFVRREVKELSTVLAAIEDPNNAVAVVGALRTPYFGASDEDIVLHRREAGTLNYLAHADSESNAIRDAFLVLRELHASRNSRGIPRVILDLFERTRAPELFLMKPTGEQRHANLMKVVESAVALEKTELISFGGFVRWLKRASQLAPEEADSPLSEEGDDFIRMLTIHKAKGLEFPVVVLADLARRRAQSENLIVDREEARLDLGFGPSEARLATLGYEEAKEREKDRRDAETVRLLYVGMTRARDLLVVPWFPSARSNENLLTHLEALRAAGPAAGVAEHATDARDLAPRAARPFRLSIKEALATDPATTEAFAEERVWADARARFARDHDRPAVIVAPSSLARGGADAEPARDLDETSPVPGAGTRLGTLVHAVMERVDFAAPDDAGDITRALAKTSGSHDLADEAASLVERALASPLLERARRARRVIREMPFAIPAGDGVLVEGKIDLVFEEEGSLVVVDYKTDAVGASGSGPIVERYRRQAEAYGLAVAAVTGLAVKEVALLLMQTGDAAAVAAAPDPEVARERLAGLIRATTDTRAA